MASLFASSMFWTALLAPPFFDVAGEEAETISDAERFLTEKPKRVKSILGDMTLPFFFVLMDDLDGVFMVETEIPTQ
jgi:hypothetical protein